MFYPIRCRLISKRMKEAIHSLTFALPFSFNEDDDDDGGGSGGGNG